MALTPATYLDRLIQEYAEQPAPVPMQPPRQYMTPGMADFEMDINGLPVPKGEAPPQPMEGVLPTPTQVAQQQQQPQSNRRPDEARRIR